jgi:hypothetical protein
MMRYAPAVLLVVMALAPVQSACGPTAGNQVPTPLALSPTPAAQPATSSPAANVPSGSTARPESQAAVDAALRDAAAHLSVGVNELQVDQVEAREWPDSSLGCPRPGIMYSQVVTPGFLIIISTGGTVTRQLEYHSDARGRVVLCQER